MEFFHDRHKKNSLKRRLTALMGMLPGFWFLAVTQTEIGSRIHVQCGYWFIMLIVMSFVWLFYAVFVKNILRDARFTIQHAHSLNERHTAQIASLSTKFEAIIASVIFVLATLGFLLTDIQCVLTEVAAKSGVSLF